MPVTNPVALFSKALFIKALFVKLVGNVFIPFRLVLKWYKCSLVFDTLD